MSMDDITIESVRDGDLAEILTSALRGEPAGPAARSSGYAGSSGFLASAVQLC